jgi:hypothetical protein
LAPGVYALISNNPPTDNSGFVVGENGVLVVDAHISGDMARQIQARVREVTDKPISELANEGGRPFLFHAGSATWIPGAQNHQRNPSWQPASGIEREAACPANETATQMGRLNRDHRNRLNFRVRRRRSKSGPVTHDMNR